MGFSGTLLFPRSVPECSKVSIYKAYFGTLIGAVVFHFAPRGQKKGVPLEERPFFYSTGIGLAGFANPSSLGSPPASLHPHSSIVLVDWVFVLLVVESSESSDYLGPFRPHPALNFQPLGQVR